MLGWCGKVLERSYYCEKELVAVVERCLQTELPVWLWASKGWYLNHGEVFDLRDRQCCRSGCWLLMAVLRFAGVPFTSIGTDSMFVCFLASSP